MKQLLTLIRKELNSFFLSPIAYIFIGTFLLVTLFIFFWVETFFARNLADVRPLFEWMPILLIFLVAALTMRMWSEERRMGTIEFLLTTPISVTRLVWGKFLAALILVVLSLLLTASLPISVAFLGDLDWGPVVGGYLATVLLASAYIAIGLYISSRNENQIVTLILTGLVTGLFYLVGSPLFSTFFGHRGVELLQWLGTGARFESVARGVIDLRDIYYYVSLIAVFLSLNIDALEGLRWDRGHNRSQHRLQRVVLVMFVLNFLGAHAWLITFDRARLDLTQDQRFSISDATKGLMEQLQEPLLIRGYFSEKTHPLLVPLVPQIRDTLREYQVVGRSKVRTEFVDPRGDEGLEGEANSKYGIKPVPFHFSDRYQAELVNSYFHILVQYGDQFEVLDFRDLIEIKQDGETDLKVNLRNLEYDLSRSIRKVLYGFQGLDQLFAALEGPIELVGYVSEKKLPKELVAFQEQLIVALEEIKKISGGKFSYSFKDPSADPVLEKRLTDQYGLRPMALSLLDTNTFYFHMLLTGEAETMAIMLPQSLDPEDVKKNIEAGLMRLSPGFMKTVGLAVPVPPEAPMGMPPMEAQKSFRMIEQKLTEGYHVESVDLERGVVDDTVDVLFVIAPNNLSDRAVFAVDQFLMKGGSVMLASSPYQVEQTANGITSQQALSGLTDWLAHQGLYTTPVLILDQQNTPFPVVVNRDLGGVRIQEVELVPYPYSIDIRGDGLSTDNGIVSGIPQVTMYWSSPMVIDTQKNKDRQAVPILRSSEQSWTSDDPSLEPNFRDFPEYGFPQRSDDNGSAAYTIAALIEGTFESFFKGKTSPLLEEPDELAEQEREDDEKSKPTIGSVIEKSPHTARLIVFSSNEFLSDQVLQISRTGGSSQFMNNLQLVENTVDWVVEDRLLLAIRSRGQFSRTLAPLPGEVRVFWEYLNYGASLLGLVIIFVAHRLLVRRSRRRSRGFRI